MHIKFLGWGIKTVSTQTPGCQPMSFNSIGAWIKDRRNRFSTGDSLMRAEEVRARRINKGGIDGGDGLGRGQQGGGWGGRLSIPASGVGLRKIIPSKKGKRKIQGALRLIITIYRSLSHNNDIDQENDRDGYGKGDNTGGMKSLLPKNGTVP